MHFKKFYQALLFALACTIAGLLLLWGGATLYLTVAQNYTAASPADCVAPYRNAEWKEDAWSNQAIW